MVVDLLRPGSYDLDTIRLAWPSFDEMIDADPTLENYDYMFLNNSALLKAKDVRLGQLRRYEHTEEPPLRREYASDVPQPPPMQNDDYERWDQPIVNDGRRPMSQTKAVKPSSISQKKASLGTTLMT
jgi:hypothetical protein